MDNIKYKLSSKTKELYNQIIELIKLSNPGYSDNNYSYENFIKECFYVFDSIVDHTPVAISKWINGESIDSKRVNIAIQNILAVEKLSDILADSLDKMEIDKNDIHSLLLKLLNETDLEITDEIRSLENHQLFAILLYSSLNIVNCNDIGDNYIETNHFKECLETLNSKITNNPIVHIYAPYGSGKTTLIQKYMSDNTDDSMIYTTDNTSDNTDDTTDNTSDNIMALISDTAKSFWEKLYESKIDTKIFNLFFQNDTSNYFAIIKNSIFFIDDFSPENVSSYIEFAKQHNLRVVFISNFSTVYSGILNYDISLTKERLQDLLLNYSKKKKIKCLSDTCMLSKLIDIIGYDLNIYHIIFKAYTILSRKESKDVADIFIQSILDYNLSILHEKYRMSLNSTDKNIKSHLKDYYNNIIPKTQRKTLLLLSKLNNHSVPRALLEKWFGINFDTIYIMVKHNLCHINNGIVHLHINSFFVYMLNLTAKWYDIDFDTYINTTIQLQEEVFKTTTKETSPLILLPILHRLMNPLSNYDKNNKSKKSCTIEQADFYFACIWYYVLHGDIAYAKTILNNLENAKYVKENSVSPFLLQHNI